VENLSTTIPPNSNEDGAEGSKLLSVTKTVRLASVTRDDGQTAIDQMEEIFDVYGLPDDTRQALWECYQVLASDVLIRFGELDPEIGHSEQNGQS